MRQRLSHNLRDHWLWWSGAILCVLLLLTAILQYRWIDRLSEADRRQREGLLDNALRTMQGDFRRTLNDTWRYFHRASGNAPNTQWEAQLNDITTQWLSDAENPALLKAVGLLTQKADGSSVYQRRSMTEQGFTSQLLPPALQFYQTVLTKRLRSPNGAIPLLPRELIYDFADDQPLLILPLVADSRSRANDWANAPANAAMPPPRQGLAPRSGLLENGRPLNEWQASLTSPTVEPDPDAAKIVGWCFLELDANYLQKQFVPEMTERFFKQPALEGLSYALVMPGEPTDSDESITLFARRIFNLDENRRPPPPPGAERRRLRAEARMAEATNDVSAWRFAVKDAAGVLGGEGAQTRRRNLAMAFGVLAVLAASFAVLLLAMRRDRRLAAQQLEFVAGVSHELRTPLAGIQTVAHNLAQGVVKDSQRMQQYGVAIQAEARRLSHQLEQVLAFAGIQSGRQLYDLRAVDVRAICEKALAAHSFEADDWEIEISLPDNLPPALADEAALYGIFNNLLHNAYKYAAGGRWLRVSGREVSDVIQLTIADRGPGVAAQDERHLFEPFYRGQQMVASNIPGAGLGLSLVHRHLQAMGGRISVRNQSNEGGAVFTLHLRIAPKTTA